MTLKVSRKKMLKQIKRCQIFSANKKKWKNGAKTRKHLCSQKCWSSKTWTEEVFIVTNKKAPPPRPRCVWGGGWDGAALPSGGSSGGSGAAADWLGPGGCSGGLAGGTPVYFEGQLAAGGRGLGVSAGPPESPAVGGRGGREGITAPHLPLPYLQQAGPPRPPPGCLADMLSDSV